MATGVYIITNTVDGKNYIGLALDINDRWDTHKYELRTNNHHSSHLQNAWNKYGEEMFIHDTIEECEEQFLYSQENYWCNMLDTHNRKYGYNIQPTHPDGRPRQAEESKRKIALKTIGHKRNVGRIASLERVEKVRKTKQEAMGKPIVILKADTGEYVCEKPSMGEVCAFLNISRRKPGNIKSVILGKMKSYMGYVYVHKEVYDSNKNYKAVDTRYKENRKTKIDINGENNPRAKVTEKEVREIRRLYKEGVKTKQLKEMYGNLSLSGIKGIISNKNWKTII